MDINFTGEMQAIPATAKGLIVKVDRRITVEQAEQIRRHVLAALGDGIKVLVLDPGLTVTATE